MGRKEKSMNIKIAALVICLLLSCFVSGCVEFATGFGSGAAAATKLADEKQEEFLTAVIALNEETARINEMYDTVDGTMLLKPETIEAIEGLRGREKDPVSWIATASVLANMFWGGKSYANRKKTP